MSTIYSFVCDECRQFVDIGQSNGGDFVLWSGKGEAYSAAERFIVGHVGHRLRVLTDDDTSNTFLNEAYKELTYD